MLNTSLKLLSFEDFKETKRIDCMSGFKETADGYSYEIYGGGRIYCKKNMKIIAKDDKPI